MSVSVYSKLNSFFNKDKNSMKEFYSIVGNKPKKAQFDTLFQFINDQVKKYKGKRNLYMIVNSINFVNDLFRESEDIDKAKIRKRLLKIQAKVMELSNKGIHNTKLISTAIDKGIANLNNAQAFSSDRYELIQYIIENSQNIEYIEKTFMYSEGFINAVDDQGNSLFYNLVAKYIKTIKEGENSKERLLYYNNIMLLMKSHPCFEPREDEKKLCLNMIYGFLGTLNSNIKDYQFRKSAINSLKETVLNKSARDIENMDELVSKYNIHINFNQKVLKDAKKVRYEYNQKRKKISDYIISIDGNNTVEIDDGLSAEKLSDGTYLLGGHIASPLSYIDITSPMIKEAINRTSSIHLHKKVKLIPNKAPISVITMFPKEFATNIVSLNERQIRSAKSYYFRIDSSGDIIESEFFESTIKNNKKCNYHEVNNILQNGCNNERLLQTVNNLQEISEILSNRIKYEKIYMDKKMNTANPSGLKVGDSLSELMVSRVMTLIGSEVATYFARNGYPLLYRVHTVSNEDLDKLKSEINKLPIDNNKKAFNELYSKLLHLYPKARNDLEGSHYGMNLEHYCHCTSPIRRAEDIVNERALDVCYFSNPSDKDIYSLEEFIIRSKDIINRQADNISMFFNEYDSIKTKLKK